MIHRPTLAALMVPLLVAGCASSSSNMRVGTDTSYMSLKDQREAAVTVKVYDKAPAGATAMGVVDASRCHRNAMHTAPSASEVLIDLKAAAFARGADGITDVKIESSSGLMQNCWSIITGKATALAVPK